MAYSRALNLKTVLTDEQELHITYVCSGSQEIKVFLGTVK